MGIFFIFGFKCSRNGFGCLRKGKKRPGERRKKKVRERRRKRKKEKLRRKKANSSPTNSRCYFAK